MMRSYPESFSKNRLSLEDCYNASFKTFDPKPDQVAKALLEKETLESEEFEGIVGRKRLEIDPIV